MAANVSPRRARAQRAAGSGIALLLLVASVTAGLSAPALAADPVHVADVVVSSASASPRESGNTFRYDIDFTCSYIGDGTGPEAASPCATPLITVPVSAELLAITGRADIQGFTDAWATTPWFSLLADSDDVDPTTPFTFNAATGNLEIRLRDAEPGVSLRLSLDFTPPNYITPNNTTWTIEPSVSGANFDPVTAPEAVTHSARAGVTYTIRKGLAYQQARFVQPGEVTDFDIDVACVQSPRGMILVDSLTVSDALPTHLSSPVAGPPPSPVGSVVENTATWTLTGADVPTSCSTPDEDDSTSIQLSATVGTAPHGTRITNTAQATATTIDGTTHPPVSEGEDLVVINDVDPQWGRWEKDSFAQLRDLTSTPDPEPTDGWDRATQLERRSHTTYPGNWNGVLSEQGNFNGMINWAPNTYSTPPMSQAGYKMAYGNEGSGVEIELRDPLPCLTSGASTPRPEYDALYASRTPVWSQERATGFSSADLCQAPAFHVTTASVIGTGNQGVGDVAPGYAPYVVYADGSTADMVLTSPANPNARHFRVPTAPAGQAEKIAMVVFPRDPGLAGEIVRFAVYGYADAAVPDLSVLENTGSVRETWTRAPARPTRTSSDSADLYVVARPQIGVDKSLGRHDASGPHRTSIQLSGRITTPAEATAPFVLADLLPEGMTVFGTLSATVEARHASGTAPGSPLATTSLDAGEEYVLEVLPNWQGSGRELVRLTVPRATLASFGPVALTARLSGTVDYLNEPGTYLNTARVYHPTPALLDTCSQNIDALVDVVEPLDLNEANGTSDHTCAARDSVTVPAPNATPRFATSKTVRGDTDVVAKPYPGIGLISAGGGSATFEVSWRNTGGAPLNRAVIYDILPHLGDTGVGGSTATQERRSEFAPTFVALSGALPPNVTVAYSQSTNPCRPEVYASQPSGCVNDWSTTVPSPASSVAALRFSSSATYAPGTGFSVPFTVTTPPVDDNTVAWNSISAVAGVAGGSMLLPNDPPKVGVTSSTSTLPLILSKKLEGSPTPSTVRLGDELTYRLSVTNNAGTAKVLNAADVLPSGLTFVAVNGVPPATDDSISFNGATNTLSFTSLSIPGGTTREWLVTARVTASALGRLTNTFKDPDGEPEDPCPEDPDAACASVEVPPSTLTVTKVVTGTGAGIAPREFTARVTCDVTLRGVTTRVLDEVLTFTSTTTSRSVSVARGAVCTVVETDDGGAHATALTPNNGVVTIDDATHDVTITNAFDADRFTVVKNVVGPGASLARGPYAFSYSCLRGAGPPSTGTLSLAGPGTSAPLGPYLRGTVCTVTESDSGGADRTPAPVEVTVGTDPVAEFTNVFSAGTITVRKQIAGTLPLTLVPVSAFSAEVTCTPPDGPARIYPVTLRAGVPAQVMDGNAPRRFALGTVCTVRETDAGGAGRVTVSPPVTVGTDADLQELDLQITNTFTAGHVQITKTLQGPGTTLHTDGFTFDVTCTHAGRTYTETATLTRTPQTATSLTSPRIGPFPVGATCTVTETTTGGADTTPDPVTLTIPDTTSDPSTDTTAVARFTNTYSAGTVSVTKKTEGRYARAENGREFPIRVTCVVDGETRVHVVRVKPGRRVTVSDSGRPVLFPLGTSCWAKETDHGGASKVRVSADSAENAVKVTRSTGSTAQELAITVVNTFSRRPPTPVVPPEVVDPPPRTGDQPPTPWTGGSPLPRTGSSLSGWEPWAVGGLVTLGAFLVWRGRRSAVR